MKQLIAAAIALLTFTSSGLASEFNRCITTTYTQSGGVGLLNICNQTINVTFCVAQPASSFACQRGAFGMKSLTANSSEPIPFYINEGSGNIYWAACVYPNIAKNWQIAYWMHECN